MSHKKLTPFQEGILTSIAWLAQALPQPLERYTKELGRIRSQQLNIPGRSRGDLPRGFIDGHEVRATAKWDTRKEHE